MWEQVLERDTQKNIQKGRNMRQHRRSEEMLHPLVTERPSITAFRLKV
jgi:hypothetical protein